MIVHGGNGPSSGVRADMEETISGVLRFGRPDGGGGAPGAAGEGGPPAPGGGPGGGGAPRRVGAASPLAARALGADPVLASIAPRAKDGDEPPEPIGAAMQGSDLILLATGRSLTHTHARRAGNPAGARAISVPGVTEDTL